MRRRPSWFRVIHIAAGGALFGSVLSGAVFGSAAELHGLLVGAVLSAIFMIEERYSGGNGA